MKEQDAKKNREQEDTFEDRSLIVLEDEAGNKEKFKILCDSLFVKDRQYVVLMPVNESGSFEPEMVILRVEEMGGGETTLVTIDDDDEWEEVLKELEKLDIEEGIEDCEIEVVDDGDEEGGDFKS